VNVKFFCLGQTLFGQYSVAISYTPDNSGVVCVKGLKERSLQTPQQ